MVLVSCLHNNGCRDYIGSLAPWIAVIVGVFNLFWSEADYAFMSHNYNRPNWEILRTLE